ncbi:SAVED domain-containing protein [Chondromyces crocatus]|uniref:SMODS-associated and fused to various effectors domain-containing protein n=1 Tax=Chondromyces crocatus TaxID=52 RepID=A0A0K1EHC8_CHOCO|nr:SAVED domain-containing protein [Chondromyces crocatus]AKT40067.1 uncharacterized protein CMC5_042200 [Chondromyces crocatus]
MHTSEDTLPRGLILLAQPELLNINPTEMTDARPEAYRDIPYRIVELNHAESFRPPGAPRNWSAEQRALDEQFHASVKPLREKHPDYSILYFGSSSIPLTLYLGYLLETWQRTEVVPRHHDARSWGWRSSPEGRPARLLPVTLPDFKDHSPGEAIIRISTSHQVDQYITRQVVPEPVLVEVDIALEHPSEDAFTSMEEMFEVAKAFRQTLDCIGDRFPRVQRVHLFASVQTGMALLLGAQISKTMHPAVQTYQYTRSSGVEPFHAPALLINGPRSPEPIALNDEEVNLAARDRVNLAQDFDRMRGQIRREEKDQEVEWPGSVLAEPAGLAAFSGMWRKLPPLCKTPLKQTRIDVATTSVEDSFRLNPANEWQIDDRWLARLAQRLPEEDRRRRALRMLVLHEAVHRGQQGLTRTLSKGIGRFPKVLEEADYHADVWGMLYERSLTELVSPDEIDRPARFFQALIRIATETMWAFDDDGQPLRMIQVRRLNRYLIWYWQYLLLEAAVLRDAGLTEVLALLAQRPIIELAGPTPLSQDERVYYPLDASRMMTPELCVYHQGRLHRHGVRIDFSLAELIEGVRERNGDAILDVLRAAAEQTAR